MKKLAAIALVGVLGLSGCKYSIDNFIYDGIIKNQAVRFERVGNLCPEAYILSIGEASYVDNVPCTIPRDYIFSPEYAVQDGQEMPLQQEDRSVIRYNLIKILFKKTTAAVKEITK